MLFKWYRAIIPKAIRRKNFKQFEEFLVDLVDKESQTRIDISEAWLKARHTENTRVLLNRKELLYELPKNAVVAEIGVMRGDYSNSILTITEPKKLYLIDPWDIYKSTQKKDAAFVQARFFAEIESGQIFIQKGYSFDELNRFEDGYFDWVYIDSDHSFQTTTRELELCSNKVKLNGIIAGHDYFTWSIKPLARFGVVEAVNYFCKMYDWEIIFLTNEPHRHISYALKRFE